MRRLLLVIVLMAVAVLLNITAAVAQPAGTPGRTPTDLTIVTPHNGAEPQPYAAPRRLAASQGGVVVIKSTTTTATTLAHQTTGAPSSTGSTITETTRATATSETTATPTTGEPERTDPPVGGNGNEAEGGGDDPDGDGGTPTTEPFTVGPGPVPQTTEPFDWQPGSGPSASDDNPLPYTGSRATIGLAAAAALLTGGCVLVWAARRRPKHARGS